MPNRAVAMDARARPACYPQSSFYPLSFALFLTLDIGSLCSAFASARDVPLAVKPACGIALSARFPSAPSRPYKRLRYFLGGLRPTQTAHQALSPDGLRRG